MEGNFCALIHVPFWDFFWKVKEKHECPVKTVGVLLEIRNMYLPNRSLECYCSISQLYLHPVL